MEVVGRTDTTIVVKEFRPVAHGRRYGPSGAAEAEEVTEHR